jgi:F0F1-type ATP synthase assembly protein I
MHANQPPAKVRTTRRRYSGAGNRASIPVDAEPGWPGLTTAQSLAVASQFGVTLAIGVGLGIFAGQWLDGVLHSGIVLTLVGALVGLVAGITNTVTAYRATLRKSAMQWRDEEDIAASRAAGSQRRTV